MSQDFTISEFRQYIKSLQIIQDDEWAALDDSLGEIASLVGVGNKITVSWIVMLAMATRKG